MDLEGYRHPDAGFSVPLPPNWERIEDPQEGVALIAAEPTGQVSFRANLVITVEPLSFGTDVETWQAGAEELLPQQLPQYMLIDRERTDTGGGDMIRRVAHYATGQTGSVTMEQWSMVVGDKGYTLTGSVATLAYDSMANLFNDMASRFRPDSADDDPEVSP